MKLRARVYIHEFIKFSDTISTDGHENIVIKYILEHFVSLWEEKKGKCEAAQQKYWKKSVLLSAHILTRPAIHQLILPIVVIVDVLVEEVVLEVVLDEEVVTGGVVVDETKM